MVGRYPSQAQSIEASAAHIAAMLTQRHPGRRLSFVTHSLGGILARFVAGPLGRTAGLDVRGVVMLAPPNGGSALARKLEPLRSYRRVYGPAGSEFASVDIPPWPVPEVPIAVIAGTRAHGLNPVGWVSTLVGLLPRGEASDGTLHFRGGTPALSARGRFCPPTGQPSSGCRVPLSSPRVVPTEFPRPSSFFHRHAHC